MAEARGCHFPEDRIYDVENHVWYEELDDGNLRIGMTSVAAAMAGKLVAFTPRRVGRDVKAGRSCATIESGKWVGPAKSAVAGEVMAANEVLVAQPALANDDPYEAWMVVLKPEGWEDVKNNLVLGSDVAGKYEAKMAADGFDGCA